MSTITGIKLNERLGNSLVVTPLLSPKQIGNASIDVRLGNQFIVFRLHTLESFPGKGDAAQSLHSMQERHVLRYGASFLLHPGMLALGATLEYVSLPGDMEAQVEGRSSWARVGLTVATATTVEPGFRGVVTLELSNVGTIPLELFPGVRIAQLVFREATPAIERKPFGENRKYRCPVGPQFSRLAADREIEFFRKQRNGSN